jgi:hypothetical protein
LNTFTDIVNTKKELLILKLDFEKAFDKLENNFILEIMRHKGFGPKWTSWMNLFFDSVTSSILPNGVLGKFFHYRRGVRQGDPYHLSFLSYLHFSPNSDE